MSGKGRTNDSLCEKSMKVVVNSIKLLSLSIAKMSLGTTGAPVVAKKNLETLTGSAKIANSSPQVPGTRRSLEPRSSSKCKSFVMPLDGGNDSSFVIHEENSVIDWRASDYIRRVHEKNRSDAHETSKLYPFILPPPPQTVK